MNKNLIKRYFFNLFGIIFSRVTGLGRDLALAGIFGAGIYSDLFYALLRLPQFFRAMLTEGVFNQAFLPHLRASARKGDFAAAVFCQMLAICALLCLIVAVFAPFFASLIAPGFSAADAALAAELMRVSIWFLFFSFAASFLASLSNYLGKFFFAAALNSIFNLSCMAGIFAALFWGEIFALKACAVAICAGAALQFVLLFVHLRRERLFVTFLKSLRTTRFFGGVRRELVATDSAANSSKTIVQEGGVRRASVAAKTAVTRSFWRSFGASLSAASAAQIGSLVEFSIASGLGAAAITYIQLATRLYQLPLSLLAIAFAQVLLPALLAKNPSARGKAAYFYAQFAALFSAACVGYFFADFIVWLLFGRGNFSAADVAQTAAVLRSYIWLIVPLGLSKIFLSELAARKLLARSAAISALSVALNIALIFALLPSCGVLAFGYAATLSAAFVCCGYAHASGRLGCAFILAPKFAVFALIYALCAAFGLYFLKGFLYANFF